MLKTKSQGFIGNSFKDNCPGEKSWPPLQLGLHFGLKNIGKITIVFEDLSRNSVFLKTEVKPCLQQSHFPAKSPVNIPIKPVHGPSNSLSVVPEEEANDTTVSDELKKEIQSRHRRAERYIMQACKLCAPLLAENESGSWGFTNNWECRLSMYI